VGKRLRSRLGGEGGENIEYSDYEVGVENVG
jgi:hypothetical protein